MVPSPLPPLTGSLQGYSSSTASSSSDIRPALDSILHDTFNLSRGTPPGTPRSTTPKPPSYIVRGQRPRPHVTLHTWQSLDGLTVDIGPETTPLSQRLRGKHDAIIGEGNFVDQKRVYLEEKLENFVDYQQEREIKGYGGGGDDDQGERHMFSASPAMRGIIVTTSNLEEHDERVTGLKNAGYRIHHAKSMEMENILETLHSAGIKKLVVEGRMVESLLTASLYDKLLISIVPIYVRPICGAPHRLTNVHCELLGSDVVITAEPEIC